MYDQTSAGRDREMDVGTPYESSYEPTPRSTTATSETDTGVAYTDPQYSGTEYVGAAYQESDDSGGNGVKEKAATAARTGAQAASEGARDVAQTAKEEARNVAGEVTTQARRVASDVGEQLRGQARQQHGTMVQKLRQASDDMRQMADGRDSSPATSLVSNLAERTNRFAEHLETRGPEGVLTDVQEFARRRPGTFLLAAAAAGFVAGRLGKSVFTAPNSPLRSDSNGSSDYREAYAAGAADTATGYLPDPATTTAAEPLIRDEGGWDDPRTDVVPGTETGTGAWSAEGSRP